MTYLDLNSSRLLRRNLSENSINLKNLFSFLNYKRTSTNSSEGKTTFHFHFTSSCCLVLAISKIPVLTVFATFDHGWISSYFTGDLLHGPCSVNLSSASQINGGTIMNSPFNLSPIEGFLAPAEVRSWCSPELGRSTK